MPKRPCPFEENLLPQLKIHVGQKEINNGVSKEERMKEVYDKTLNLLKEGVRVYSQKLSTSQLDLTELSPSKITSRETKSERTLKQMVLNNKLELQSGKKVISDAQADLCGCCRVIDSRSINKCYYCDQILCSYCLTHCMKCSESFCQNCSLPTYDSEENTNIHLLKSTIRMESINIATLDTFCESRSSKEDRSR
ncbi:hypothetical protein KPH14_009633 [Odynerus spinipes]|uniref:Apoptosis regulatory protein Siva n=1 Tax=Odynerus spinipes TaxID=1348599 RepID=A0AAD9VQX8_9HYME|nr:hypothetical protein KPH14_009633 [Odynerus spinipes]